MLEQQSLILAKIHMVTKHQISNLGRVKCLILAKIHMVTKHKYHKILQK